MSLRTRILFVAALLSFSFACGGSQPKPDPAPDDSPAVADEVNPMLAACQAGTAKSCLVAAGGLEEDGKIGEAAKLYMRACELGETVGCTFAGGAFAELADVDNAAEAFGVGCGEAEAMSCYGLGLVRMGLYGGEPDAVSAAAAFQRGCGQGQADSCAALADLVEAGEGVEPDAERATVLRRQACEAGAASACTRLGLRALQGDDEAEARRLFEASCAGDVVDVEGCAWSGWARWSGLGGEANQELGAATLKSACDGGSATGCAFLGVVREREGDANRGRELLDRACSIDPEQCEALRLQYESFVEQR